MLNVLKLSFKSKIWNFQWRIQDFPGGRGCANSQIGIILQIFCRKLHENKRILTRGARPWRPPLRSANGTLIKTLIVKIKRPNTRCSLELFLNGVELSSNSSNSGNLINHYAFADPGGPRGPKPPPLDLRF